MKKNKFQFRGAQLLSKQAQKSLKGGGSKRCSCYGKPTGTPCFYYCHPACPGICANNSCIPF